MCHISHHSSHTGTHTVVLAVHVRRTPVVVLTSSARPEDKEAAYDAHVAGYLVKPLDYDECVTLLGALADYWRVVQLP